MEVKEEHKDLLRGLGLCDRDFELFDGKFVRYEYDREKGVRIYDPYYATSFEEYIDADGWSSWSIENDTFMTNIIKDAQAETQRREAISQRPGPEEVAEAIRRKFNVKDND
ncbi:conserved hypothetical protein [uncultured Desulfobacterium sp.]|uniref:Uncharacterized protein n=1 Tax=uncultured Desulfobacterium sp. TaxID=201089 RepID=A0A445N384_9BACT|nr:conserved hypothetical protein [uncultured Desulfobacterium sp.]